jgi:hypothetical protein
MDPLLLPSIHAWAKGFPKPVSAWDVVNARGGLEMAVVFSKLFWPDFVEIGGFVVLAERLDADEFDRWLSATAPFRDPVAWDNVSVYDLFLNESESFDESTWRHLAEVLRGCWQASIDRRFPEHMAMVSLSVGEHDYGPTLSIFQLPETATGVE